MSDDLRYPLAWPMGWPRTIIPMRSRFGSGFYRPPTLAAGRDALMAELTRLGAWQIVISTNAKLKSDGMPSAAFGEPKGREAGVAIYFQLEGKRIVMPCDRWESIGENLLAVAKHIEAMRGQERWGVGNLQRAFAGYAALEERTGPSPWDVLGIAPTICEATILDAWKAKATLAHPDAATGSHEAFIALNQAKDIALATVRSRSTQTV